MFRPRRPPRQRCTKHLDAMLTSFRNAAPPPLCLTRACDLRACVSGRCRGAREAFGLFESKKSTPLRWGLIIFKMVRLPKRSSVHTRSMAVQVVSNGASVRGRQAGQEMTATMAHGLDRRSDPQTKAKKHLPLLPVAALLREQGTMTGGRKVREAERRSHDPRAGEVLPRPDPLRAPQAGRAVRVRGRPRSLHGVQGMRRRLPHAERARRERDVAHRRALARRAAAAPAQQTVTTSCHHCVEPACMRAAPWAPTRKIP